MKRNKIQLCQRLARRGIRLKQVEAACDVGTRFIHRGREIHVVRRKEANKASPDSRGLAGMIVVTEAGEVLDAFWDYQGRTYKKYAKSNGYTLI